MDEETEQDESALPKSLNLLLNSSERSMGKGEKPDGKERVDKT